MKKILKVILLITLQTQAYDILDILKHKNLDLNKDQLKEEILSNLQFYNFEKEFNPNTTRVFSLPQATNSQSFYIIKPADFNNSVASGGAAYTIDTSGYYFIPTHIIFSPANDNVVGIKIDAENVILDLNTYSLSQSSTTTHKSLTAAIQIASGRSNIGIRNGTIFNINGNGIKVGPNSHNIAFNTIIINTCYDAGVNITDSYNFLVRDLIITDCNGKNANATTGAIGLKMTNTKNMNLSECYFHSQNSTTKDATGAWLSNCSSIRIEKTGASGNTGVNSYGFRLTDSTRSVILRDCNSIDNISSNGNSIGLLCDYVKGISIVDFFIGSNKSTGGDCVGVKLNSSSGCDFMNCFVKDHSTTGGAALYGYKFINSKNCRFLDSCSISHVSTSTCYGYYLSGCSANVFYNCEARGHSAAATTNDCYGFYCTGGSGNSFVQCRATNNQGGLLSATAKAAGFAFRNGESYDGMSECISGGNSTAGEAYGIMLGHTNDTGTVNYTILFKNQIFSNIGSKKYGLRDFAANSTTLMAGNISVGHGAISPSTSAQLTLTNAMNFMFTYTTLQYPGNVISEVSVGQVGLITSGAPYANLSVKIYP